ncbi:hypothetical protein PIB30_038162 [Stylosanthes scabra]|uniref:Uncharacterized protein n=1 Tax=Stylosanthes scabra TaxID=79078 RepID=A0ABU6XE45_9FABA|nr:hypothetical protein [Stylosanthes scabra]
MAGRRGGARASWNGGKDGVEMVPFFFNLGALQRVKEMVDTVGDASARVKEMEFGGNGFGLIWALNLVFEAQTKKENDDYLISDPLKLRMVTLLVLGQFHFYASKNKLVILD